MIIKAGTKVRVRTIEEMLKIPGVMKTSVENLQGPDGNNFVSDMFKYCGTIHFTEDYYDDSNKYKRTGLKGCGFVWSSWMFEVITTEDSDVKVDASGFVIKNSKILNFDDDLPYLDQGC